MAPRQSRPVVAAPRYFEPGPRRADDPRQYPRRARPLVPSDSPLYLPHFDFRVSAMGQSEIAIGKSGSGKSTAGWNWLWVRRGRVGLAAVVNGTERVDPNYGRALPRSLIRTAFDKDMTRNVLDHLKAEEWDPDGARPETVIIFDDVTGSRNKMNRDTSMTEFYTTARHAGGSIFQITHSIRGVAPDMRDQAQRIYVFAQDSPEQIKSIWNVYGAAGRTFPQFLSLFQFYTAIPHVCLVIDRSKDNSGLYWLYADVAVIPPRVVPKTLRSPETGRVDVRSFPRRLWWWAPDTGLMDARAWLVYFGWARNKYDQQWLLDNEPMYYLFPWHRFADHTQDNGAGKRRRGAAADGSSSDDDDSDDDGRGRAVDAALGEHGPWMDPDRGAAEAMRTAPPPRPPAPDSHHHHHHHQHHRPPAAAEMGPDRYHALPNEPPAASGSSPPRPASPPTLPAPARPEPGPPIPPIPTTRVSAAAVTTAAVGPGAAQPVMLVSGQARRTRLGGYVGPLRPGPRGRAGPPTGARPRGGGGRVRLCNAGAAPSAAAAAVAGGGGGVGAVGGKGRGGPSQGGRGGRVFRIGSY